MLEPSNSIQFFILISLALIVPLLFSRLRRFHIPIVVGEILAGMLVGKSGFNLITVDEPTLMFLADFGLVFLLFLAGINNDFSIFGFAQTEKTTARQGWSPLAWGALLFGTTLLLAIVVSLGFLLAGWIASPWMLALVLASTSISVVGPVMRKTSLISGRFEQTVRCTAQIADFVSLALMTAIVTVLSTGLTLALLLATLVVLCFFLAYRYNLFGQQLPAVQSAIDGLIRTTSQFKVRFAFAIILVFVLLSEVLGVEMILGAFAMGATIALISRREDDDLSRQLEGIGYGFLIPIFFIVVGVNLDLRALLTAEQPLLFPFILMIAALAVKLLPALLLKKNFTWRETITAGFLLSTRLTVIIVASFIGLRLNLIDPDENAAILLVALITVTIGPLIFMLFAPQKLKQQRPTVVIGAGELGLETAALIRSHQERVIVIDPDLQRLDRAKELGHEVVHAEVEQNDPRAMNYLDDTRVAVVTYSDTQQCYSACSVIRLNYGIPVVVSQVTNPAYNIQFEKLGVQVVNPAEDRAALLVMLARNPATFSILMRMNNNKEISELIVENEVIAGKALCEIELPGDVLVIAIRRKGDIIVPHGETRLERGDALTMVGSCDWIEQAKTMIEIKT